MKKSLILISVFSFSLLSFAQGQDPVLMKINGKDITRSEFEYIYNKNNSNNELDKKTLEEYVDLFINFKLKVAAAEEAGLDTTKAFKSEFQGYRQQLVKPYLTDESVDEKNALEVYNRLKENVEASHILVRVAPDASEMEISEAYNKANKARQRILKGEAFDKVAREVSEDPSVAQNGGYLGYFTAMQMVYPFEDAAYNLKIGEVSEPVRTDFGYHVIKVTNRRPDIGKILVAHIFKFLPQDASKEREQELRSEMDSIYHALLNGADFAEMAKSKSEDRGTAARGGELPWIGLHQTVKEFEDVAFNLKKDEISKPFNSPNGIHIVKLIDRKQIEPFEEKKDEITRRLNRQGRGNKGVEALIAKLKNDYRYSFNEGVANQTKAALSQLQELKGDTVASKNINVNGSLFTLAGKSYPAQDFLEWADNRTGNPDKVIEDYVNKEILNYEDSQLEKKYTDFGHLMREYRDGILLFEISNNLVWDKASKDDEGLASYFKKNKSDYAWKNPRFKGIIVHCKDKGIEKQTKKLLKKQPEDEWLNIVRTTFNNDSVTSVKVVKGLYAKGDNKYVDKLIFKTGSYEPVEDFPYTFVFGKKLKKGPETYKDVRGPVTADYQNYLETAWIDELRNKYKVEINEEVLKTVNNH